jgi:hypothetical protein
MKTAMQEMFEELYAHSFEIPIGLLAKCEELMEREKEQIRGAFLRGSLSWATRESFEQYYNETYGDDK